MFKLIAILFLISPLFGLAWVNTIGTPKIQNFPKSVYNAGTQNWGIAQDKNGYMYFANNDGVLRFDGLHWDLIKVSESSPVRSIFIDEKNNIYIGLFNDFGILESNVNGLFQFRSFKYLLPAGMSDFDDIWRICNIQNGIIFQTFEYLFVLGNNKIEVVKPEKSFHFSFNTNNRLFLHEPGVGIFEYSNGIIGKVKWSDELKDNDICTVIEIQDNSLLIGTARNGIYLFEDGKLVRWNTPANVLIEQSKLFCAVKISDDYLAFGTILNGIVISDSKGKVVQHIDRNKGLQNNTVLSIFSDKNNNLWLGLDNGIDYVEIDSPISFIADFEKLGTGYCCRVFKGDLYIGTNQGLYVQSFYDFENNSYNKFELVQNTAGQVWSLSEFDGQLICGHNSGTFVIEGKRAKSVASGNGAWRYIRLKNYPDYLLGGSYNGLELLKKGGNGWEFYKKVEGFNESSRFLIEDHNGSVWISHGAKGIYKVNLTKNLEEVKDFKLYTSKDGLPDVENNILFQFKGEEYISTVKGIYSYQPETDSFSPNAEINKLFDINGRIKTIETDSTGNIWFISENESGVLRLNEDLTYTKITTPFKQLEGKYVNEFEFVYPFRDEHVFFGLDHGFAHYTSKFPKLYSQSFSSFITSIELTYIDSVLFQLDSTLNYEFPFSKNEFRFHYSAPFFENYEKLKFSYFLENFSEEWSDWSPYSYKDFANLHEGRYIFNVKALNVYGVESEISRFIFTIKPPWYRSSIAYYSYLVLFFIIAFLSIKFILRRIEFLKVKERMTHQAELQKREEQFQHKAVIAEKEIIKLKNEKLLAEMIHRDKELANQTMNVIQKNRFLMKLNLELQRMQSATNDGLLKTKIAILKKRIDREIDDEQLDKIFETHFDEVHEDFFKKLKEKYPQLSPKDLRLCAYIKMDISTKEISTLLNISYRGVEISRYRLRKKMELPREINLSTYLSSI